MAVEFALVLVLFLTLVFAVIQYGYYFFQLQGASAGTREGARLASLGVNNCTTLANSVQAAAAGVKVTNVKIEFTPGGTATQGADATATVTYAPTTFGFPFVPFITGSPTQKAVSRVESLGSVTSGSPYACNVNL
ncbi:MAG: TadE/TadG family type IV pilus assembly protein [Pseudonocardiales bacterium]